MVNNSLMPTFNRMLAFDRELDRLVNWNGKRFFVPTVDVIEDPIFVPDADRRGMSARARHLPHGAAPEMPWNRGPVREDPDMESRGPTGAQSDARRRNDDPTGYDDDARL